MKTNFTPIDILTNRGCYNREQVQKLSFIGQPEINIDTILDSEIPLKDKLWFVRNQCELDSGQKKWLCIGIAEITLVIYENKYPGNKAPRQAIEAAKAYLKGTIGINELRDKRQLAYAAAAADAAAYAADAAAYAADAAAYAYAAAAADAAAADAAYAADAAAYAAAYDAPSSGRGKDHFKNTIIAFVKLFLKS
jgi:hypothetical protein